MLKSTPKKSLIDDILQAQNKFLAYALGLAEVGLSPSQFRQYKKMLQNNYHNEFKTKTILILKDQVGPKANSDNLGKGGEPMTGS